MKIKDSKIRIGEYIHRDDVLNAVLTDLVADQIKAVLYLGFTESDVYCALKMAKAHGEYEYNQEMEAIKKEREKK